MNGWVLLGFIGLGVFLRVYNFWSLDLWIDEYSTWWVIAGDDWMEIVRRTFHTQGYSPLYFFLIKPFSDHLGPGPIALRLPSVIFGIGILVMAYPLALRIFADRHTALLAVAAFAVNERLIFFSQDARPYSLALFFAMLSFFFFLPLLSTERLSNRIGYLLATAALYYSVYLMGFAVVIQMAYLFLKSGWSWVRAKAWSLTFLALGLICLPGGIQVFSLFQRRHSLDYIQPAGPLGPFRLAFDFLNPWVFVAVSVVVLALSITGHGSSAPQFHGLDLLLLWFLLPIACFGIIPPLFGVSLLKDKYLLVAIPAAILFMAWVMAVERRTFLGKWIPLGVFLTLTFAWTLIPALRITGTFSYRSNENWKQAAAFIENYAQDDDLIVYRVGFVQPDQVVLPKLDPLTVSFIEWPLTANLSLRHRYEMIGLPYRENSQTAPYISSIVKKAAQRRRVWIIGTTEQVTRFAQTLLHTKPFRLRERAYFGRVRLFLLEQSHH